MFNLSHSPNRRHWWGLPFLALFLSILVTLADSQSSFAGQALAPARNQPDSAPAPIVKRIGAAGQESLYEMVSVDALK